jgi:NADPH:quinone reductase-like Zn-dependent oxidoreductase
MNWFGQQQGEGYEYHLLVIGLAAALLVTGAGRWSIGSAHRGTSSGEAGKEGPAMLVVLGATGHTGAVVAETLLARKQPVRVVVRSADKGAAWAAKGAEVAVASLDDQCLL